MEDLLEINKKAKGLDDLVKINEDVREKVIKFLYSSF